MLIAQLFFGQTINAGHPIPAQRWNGFLEKVVTPRFPNGLTVYDAYGQWQDPGTKIITREKSKVVLIAVDDSASARSKVTELISAYTKTFHQHSVGLVSTTECAAF
jgi:hypothetical protein